MSCYNLTIPRVIELCNPNIHQKGMIHPRRLMNVHDFVYCAFGKWTIFMDGVPYTMEKDDLLILHAGIEHFGKTPCEPGTKVYYLHVYPADGDCFHDVPSLTADCAHINSFVHCQNNAEIKKLFKEIISTFWIGSPQSAVKASLLLQILLLRLSETEQNNLDKSVSLAQNCIRLINSHSDCFLSPDDLAKTLTVSERTLRNAFKQVYNTTPYHYQRDMKLKQAIGLMKEYPDLHMCEIAFSLGFYDECHFSKVFKSKYGVSPGKYRNSLTENDDIPGIDFIPIS